ncbi:GIP [Symbiodinium sp. CCMP2456]|nr:GIP [Symbiodinium sp. CCMP2456]
MQTRDTKMSDLQSENAELRQLLVAMMDATASAGGVSGDNGATAGTAPGTSVGQRVIYGQEASVSMLPRAYQYPLDEFQVIMAGNRGIQQLQQLQLKKDFQDPELLKGNIILELAKMAYYKFQSETPLKLEKRVMALLLATMSQSIKAEITMLRIDKVKNCLFKLFTIYAPGGASERASLIKQLEYIQPQSNIVEMIASLHKWKKLVGRAAEMGDVNFKLNMAKSELGLPYKPALSAVLTYADHVIAERQQVIPFSNQTVKLKGANVDPGSPSSSASPTGKGQGQKQQPPCKFWSTDEGCRRGANCKFTHAFANKEDKKARRWTCGATTHRQADCPTKSGGKRGGKGGSEKRSQGPHAVYISYVNAGAPFEGSGVYGNLDLGQMKARQRGWTTWRSMWATGERASLRRMLMDDEAPVKATTETEVASLVGVDEKILLSDEAGAYYLKSLPYNRAMRKRLLRTRWIVHLYNGDERGAEFTHAESDDVTVARMDIRGSKIFDLRTYGPAARALLSAAARGQIEGVLGGPPRGSEHGTMLFKRLMLTWLVANSGAVRNALCAPHFTMEAPTWHPIWTSSAWPSFRDELRFMKYHSVAVQGNMYFLASSLEVSQGMDIEEAAIISLNYGTPDSSWPTALKAGLAQSMLNWRPNDLQRHEVTLCKVVGSRDLNAKDLAYWQTHIKNNHVPYDKRYLLVGAYCHPKLDLPRDVKLPPVEEEEIVEPGLDPFEEEDKEPRPEEADDEEQKAMNERYKEIYKDIGDDIECQTLHFWLRGLELKAKEMADRDILATTGESQQPQQNGRAEALVRDIKRRVKVLLRAAHLPASCWPLAAEFAARRQRDLALGNYEDKDLSFGAPTHVKHKQFGQDGRYDLLERWREGVFVGYSNDVKGGRVVRHEDGTYTTSVHIKPYLFDPGDLVEFGPYEMELPVPERRVRGKATLAQLLREPDNDIDRLAKDLLDHQKFTLEDVVGLWSVLRTKARPTSRTSQGEGLQWLVGQYTYGSQCGVVRDTDLYLVATTYLVQAFKKLTGRGDFTSLLITEDYDYADEWKELPKGGWMTQSTYDILCNYGFQPPPLPPQVPDELQRAVLKMMTMGDQREPDAVMFLVNEVEEEKRERARDVSRELCQLQDDVLTRLRERQEWLKEFLAEEEILAEELQVVGEAINEEIEGINGAVRDLLQDVEEKIKLTEEKCHSLYLKVANVTDETNIGDIEVKANLDKWVEPMSKELSNLEEKTSAIERKTIHEARQMERDGLLVLIPGKVVFTVKPPPPLTEAEQNKSRTPRWKRKARVAICGNMAHQKHDPNDLFAAGASVEGLRLGLALASARLWIAAATDVSAAFLQALWPEGRPTYGVLPPKALVQAGLVSANVVFIVKKALYGLRESPALWSAHRTNTLKRIKVKCGDGFMWLKQLATDGELWMVLWTPTGGKAQLVGLLVTYVLYLKDTILRLHEVIGATWPCSPLEFATEGLRYLGMELFQEEAVITLGQEAYISNLVRLHNLDSEVSAGLPCPREWIQDDDDDGDDVAENYSDDELRKAQKITGKQPMVAMSVCEAELMEGSNCALLLESAQAMLQEVLPTTAVPVLNVDNQAACNILTGSVGSWRTRHLRVRHVYVLDRVSNGCLTIQHLAGEDQPADLPTKLHSRARLLHLLGTWGMVGLPGLDKAKVLKGLKLGCMFLLLLAIQSLAVSAAKDPLPMTGTTELFLMVVLTCISTVALWETGRALGKWLLPICCETRKMTKIRKLKELARVAAEAEGACRTGIDEFYFINKETVDSEAQITIDNEAQITVDNETQITVTNEAQITVNDEAQISVTNEKGYDVSRNNTSKAYGTDECKWHKDQHFWEGSTSYTSGATCDTEDPT